MGKNEVRYKSYCPLCRKPNEYIVSGTDVKVDQNFKVKCLTCGTVVNVEKITETTRDDKHKILEVKPIAIN